tara:strand:- start:17525 stop:18487 length:963 start_codon:yes stop_codon:yes gene_type:complete
MNREGDNPERVQYKIAAFYCFASIQENTLVSLLNQVVVDASNEKIKGMVLLANEGVNGTICGTPKAISFFIEKIQLFLPENKFEIKYSWSSKQTFRKFRARRKAEIVTMGIEKVDPRKIVGEYVEPADWHRCLDDPYTLVIDTRNKYEIAVGTFQGSLNPNTDTFREFPDWVEQTLRPLAEEKNIKHISMFCTGGIRCEKATSYLKEQGFESVKHLHGGILRYLEETPRDESRWEGECFVFDRRVALSHNLSPGTHRLCNACGMPLSAEDLKKENYIRGVKCHYCADRFTDADRLRFAERQKHIDQLTEKFPGNTLWPNP